MGTVFLINNRSHNSVTVTGVMDTRIPSFDTVLSNAKYSLDFKYNSCCKFVITCVCVSSLSYRSHIIVCKFYLSAVYCVFIVCRHLSVLHVLLFLSFYEPPPRCLK